jgi:glycosyltransferase involved in cell wall biosynthesis
MRYAWEMQEQYLDDFRVPRLFRPPLRALLHRMRRWDCSTAKRTDVFIANSATTAERIERIYGRKSVVVPPPVSARFFEHTCIPPLSGTKGFLAFGRLVPYKRFDLLINAANERGFDLTIAGTGQDERRLQSMAGQTVRFLGRVEEEDLPTFYHKYDALLFPQLEDAGIVPLEAQASGLPVIAYGKGGATETVVDGVTGVLFPEQTEESLLAAIDRFREIPFDRTKIRFHAERFSQTRFRDAITTVVEEAYERFRATGRAR